MKCNGCGRTTNSATSNYALDTEIDGKTPKECGVATQCYAAFVDGKWVKGCSYGCLDPAARSVINHLFSRQGV